MMLMLPAAIRRNENLVQQVQQVERLQQQNSQLHQTEGALRQQLNKETIRYQQQARAAGQHGRGFAEMQLRHGDAQLQVRSCTPLVAAASICCIRQSARSTESHSGMRRCSAAPSSDQQHARTA